MKILEEIAQYKREWKESKQKGTNLNEKILKIQI